MSALSPAPPAPLAPSTREDEIEVDGTTLSAVSACDLRTVLRHVQHRAPLQTALPLTIGSLIHRVLEGWFRGGTRADALRVLDEGYPLDVPETDRFNRVDVRRILSLWLDKHPADSFEFGPPPAWGIEVPIRRYLCTYAGYRIYFVGRSDLIAPSREGPLGKYWWVVDHKTGKGLTEWWCARQRKAAQFTGYCWGATTTLQEQAGPEARFVGVIVNGIELPELPGSCGKRSTKCRLHGVQTSECGPFHTHHRILPCTRTPQQIEAWRRSAIHLAKRFVRLRLAFSGEAGVKLLPLVPTQGTFRSECPNCDFDEFCDLGRPFGQLARHTTEYRWHPFLHEGA